MATKLYIYLSAIAAALVAANFGGGGGP